MKHALIILNRSGDTRFEWTDAQVETQDPAVEQVLEEAAAAFERHRALGYMAFETTTAEPEKGKVVKTFRPEAERVTMVPQYVGG